MILPATPDRSAIDQRFDARLRRDGDCLLWTGAVHHSGYGAFAITHRLIVRAHRYAFARAHGPIPPGVVVRHRCDRKLCCDLAHLLDGSQAENVADRQERDRQARGAAVATAKLTETDVLAIRAATAAGTSVADLSDLYVVSPHTIRGILNGRTWKHV